MYHAKAKIAPIATTPPMAPPTMPPTGRLSEGVELEVGVEKGAVELDYYYTDIRDQRIPRTRN